MVMEGSKVTPRGWRDGASRPEGVSASEKSDRGAFAAHDAETINPHQDQTKLGKQVNRVRDDRYVKPLAELAIHARPP